MKYLSEAFAIMKRYGIKLNLKKCTFGVRDGKFLGFMVNERGIEANPVKIKTIMEMWSPSSTMEIQQLAGKVVALNQFISRLANRNLPFFETLHTMK